MEQAERDASEGAEEEAEAGDDGAEGHRGEGGAGVDWGWGGTAVARSKEVRFFKTGPSAKDFNPSGIWRGTRAIASPLLHATHSRLRTCAISNRNVKSAVSGASRESR